MMRSLGNLLWFFCGGALLGLAWWGWALLCFISIIGIPWGRACFVIGKLAFMPFGKSVVHRRDLNGADDIGTGPAGFVGNVIWLVCGGLWLALGHALTGGCCFLTIIGIPFGIQHFKLARLAFAPIGKSVVNHEQAAVLQGRY
jgi:uncharacterized membrane protein YccF (DUF307 family)